MAGYDLASLGLEVRADGVIVATKALKDFTKESKDAESQAKRLKGATDSSTSSFRSMESSLSLVKNVLKFEIFRRAADEIYTLGKNVYNTNLEMQAINNTFKAATGSAYSGGKEMQFLRDEAKRLGLDLRASAEGYKTLTAAARGTVLEGEQARNIFLAVAEAGAVLGLSNSKMEMSLYAVQQMISKGVVSMEELRRQLGDQIPGAFQIAARSMGMTEKDFNKLVESGQLFTQDFMPSFVKAMRDQFAGGVEDASQSARAELNRFNNAILELKLEIGNGGFFEAMTGALREFALVLDDPQMKENMRALGAFAGTAVAGIANVGKIANLRGQAETLRQLESLRGEGAISEEEYNTQFQKHTGWTGGVNQRDRGWMEGVEEKLEVQQFIDSVLAEQIRKQKEINELQNPALLSRQMEAVAKTQEEIDTRTLAQTQKQNEAREKGLEEWQKSVQKINDTQRAVIKLNDDYNVKVLNGVTMLEKYGIAKEQAETISKGGTIDSTLLSTEQRRVVEVAQRTFEEAKKYRDEEEAQIYAKEDRVTQKVADEALKRQKKLNDVNEQLAELTMSEMDSELAKVDIKFQELAQEIGKVPPELVRWRDLQKELIQQNFADDMKNTMNDYVIQLRDAQVATSGTGSAAVEVLSLQAAKTKELTNLRKEYYRVGADNSFYDELTGVVTKQYDLKIGAAEYAASWEKVSEQLEHTKALADLTGQGVYEANKKLLESQLNMVRGDLLLDPVIKARQEMELMVELSKMERDYRKEIAATLSETYSLQEKNSQRQGDIDGMYGNRVKSLQQEIEISKYSYETAANYAEQAYYAAQLVDLAQQLKDAQAEASLDVGGLIDKGMRESAVENRQNLVDYYQTMLPDAIGTTSDAMAAFAREVASGNASIEDAWKSLGQTIADVVADIIQDLTAMYLRMAIMGLVNMMGFGGGFNVGGGIGTSTGTGGGFNMGGGVVSGLHGGGIVGSESTFQRFVDMGMFNNAPRFHNGLMPDEYPAILKRKEGVFTPEQMKALGSGNGGANVVSVYVTNNTNAQASVKESNTSNGKRIDVMIEEVVAKSITSRGIVGQAVQTSFNASYRRS